MNKPNPPYLRIVEDIRHRIESGELQPGDQVPSARRITREWGVAIATATKVLAALSQEGLVTVVPGVGTLVAATGPKANPPTRRRQAVRDSEPELSRERVVRAAVDIADAEGMAALSMRRVATELDVATMSLYRHVGSKDDLVVFMIDEAIGDEAFPESPPAGWRARLELSTRLQWTVFRRHPWLARAMSVTRPQIAPNALRHTEWAFAALDGLGLSPSELLHVHLLLFSYVRGLAMNLESEAEAEQDTGMTSDEWMQGQEAALAAAASSGAFANFLRIAMEEDFDLDLDTLFEFGLTRLLDGLEVFLNEARLERGSTAGER